MLVLGPAVDGTPLELVAVIQSDGTLLIIMRCECDRNTPTCTKE